MVPSAVRSLLLVSVAALALSLCPARDGAAPPTPAVDVAVTPGRTVYLSGKLAEEDFIAFSANLAATGRPDVLLVDMPTRRDSIRRFLDAFHPDAIVPVGPNAEAARDLTSAVERPTVEPVVWQHRPPLAFLKKWFDHTDRVVLCPANDRRLLLQSAALAGALHAPLLLSRGEDGEAADYRKLLSDWKTQEVYAVGPKDDTVALLRDLPHVRTIRLADEATVAASILRHRLADGPVPTLVVANPVDTRAGSAMSLLAPWLATTHNAVLLLTNAGGDNTQALVSEAVRHPRIRGAENLIIAADLQSIPAERRPNPIAGKDAFIEMEPLTPDGDSAFSFATGRLFHEDIGVVCLQLARQKLLDALPAGSPRKAMVVSDPGGDLPLLGMFSKSTLRELRNCGYHTTAMFGDEIQAAEVRRLMGKQDIFLWEGHHSTLIKQFGFAEWTEPLPPSLVFLQSCLALTDTKTHHLFERGAVAVVGTSTRTYSGSGGAFSLAYFDALMYDQRSLGGSLRQAKNFMLCYGILKEKRLGKEAKLTGANQRSSWAFTLWGDPTVKLPAPPPPGEPQAAVKTEAHGSSIVLTLPDTAYSKITSGKFSAEMRPNARLAGLISKDVDDEKHLVPFVFAEVELPKGANHHTPHLHSRIPESHWAFVWDERRHSGYLLVTPRPRDQRELRFHITWDEEKEVGKQGAKETTKPGDEKEITD